jgi:hypothetical protein
MRADDAVREVASVESSVTVTGTIRQGGVSWWDYGGPPAGVRSACY